MQAVRRWNEKALLPGIQQRLRREYVLLQAVATQIKELETERKTLIATGGAERTGRGVPTRREVGGLTGLVPTPYASGNSYHEQGISKAGNRWVRAMMIQLAWAWLRYQPDSELTHWWRQRYEKASKRERKKGIVALARKLIVAYWQFLDKGVVPAGAQLKPVL